MGGMPSVRVVAVPLLVLPDSIELGKGPIKRASPVSKEVRARVARNLISARESAGLSQRQLASVSGVSQRLISQLEAGITNASLDKLAALASALGIELKDLVGS
jgi:ribosome-binding protein aMBF1 (putative translation factor)